MPDIVSRAVADVFGGLSGPLVSRLLVQLAVALVFALGDGITDARASTASYFLRIGARPASERRQRALQAWDALLKVFSVAVLLDCVVQLLGFGFTYPMEAMAMALFLAILPYAVLRGFVSWIVRTWMATSRRVSS
jgi:hypothetical protein